MIEAVQHAPVTHAKPEPTGPPQRHHVVVGCQRVGGNEVDLPYDRLFDVARHPAQALPCSPAVNNLDQRTRFYLIEKEMPRRFSSLHRRGRGVRPERPELW